MKAKEYAEQYKLDLTARDGGEEVALRNLILELFTEVTDLCEKRCGSRVAVNVPVFWGAWNEINAKWKSIAYNNPEFGLKPEGFRDYCKKKGMLPE